MCRGVDIKLKGLHSELNVNIYKKLSNIDTNVKLLDEKLKKLANVVKTSVRVLGYYSPCVVFSSRIFE